MRIDYLADHPEWVPILAAWFYEEWGQRNPVSSLERTEKSLRERLNRHRLPLALVAFQGLEPVGSASLKIQEMDTHKHLLHWLGTVYVQPESRRQGIGSQLAEHAVLIAQRLGLSELYLYTVNRERMYARLEWRPVERTRHQEQQVVIMRRDLGPRTA